jgi:F-type H+-transporting ATPase subunit alpha
MLKQPQYSPMPMEEQVVSILSCTPQDGRESWVRSYELSDLQRYEREMLEYMRTRHAEILETIRSSGKLEPDTKTRLVAALDEFGKIFQPSANPAKSAAA